MSSQASQPRASEPATAGDAAGVELDPRMERTRAAILEAASELLVCDGPDAISHAQVALAAKVSRTTVYNHFPDRAALLRATIEAFAKPRPSEVTGDVRTDLRRLLEGIVTDLLDEQRSRAFATMIERAQHDDTVAAVRDDLICEGQTQFAQIVANGITAGLLRSDIDVDLAMSGLLGTLFFRRFMVGRAVAHDEIEHLVDEFLRDHAPR